MRKLSRLAVLATLATASTALLAQGFGAPVSVSSAPAKPAAYYSKYHASGTYRNLYPSSTATLIKSVVGTNNVKQSDNCRTTSVVADIKYCVTLKQLNKDTMEYQFWTVR